MGYILLWLESLVVSLVLLATVISCLGRLRPSTERVPTARTAAAVLAAWTGLVVLGWLLRFGVELPLSTLYPLLIAVLCFTVAMGWYVLRGCRRWTRILLSLIVLLLPLVIFWPLRWLAWEWLCGLRGTDLETLLLERKRMPRSAIWPHADYAALVLLTVVAAVPLAVVCFRELVVFCWRKKPGPGRHWLTESLAILVGLVPLALYLGAAAFVDDFAEETPKTWFLHTLYRGLVLLAVVYGIGAGVLLILAFRSDVEVPSVVRAAAWPRVRLALVFAVALALHLATFWNMDQAVKRELANLRAEAGTLALSALPAKVPDQENAALWYEQAFQLMAANEFTDMKGEERPERWDEWTDWIFAEEGDFEDPELRAYLEDTAAVTALARVAAGKPGCRFDRDFARPSPTMLLPELQSLRSIGTLLALEARVKAMDGDVPGALENVDALFALAEHTASEPIVVSMMVGGAIDRMALATLQNIVTSTRPGAEELNDVWLSGTVSYRRLLERCVRFQEASGLWVFQEHLEMAEWWGESRAFLYRLFVIEDDLALYRQEVSFVQQWVERPYYSTRESRETFRKRVREMPSWSIATLCLGPQSRPAINVFAGIAALGDAQREVVRLALAAYRYRADKDRLPETLGELTPHYLPAILPDPFDAEPIKLKRTDEAIVFYSIGPDMIDDGGAALSTETKRWDSQPTGDVVFRLPN